MRYGTVLIVLGAVVLAGCASAPDKPGSPEVKRLYQGKPAISFGTELPVSSPEEAERRGDAALHNEDLDRALFEYVRALELDSKRPETLYKVATIHVRRGNNELAALAYDMALRLAPDHVGALEGSGLLLLRQHRYAEAEEKLKGAADRDVRRWRAQNALGVIADLRGQHEMASYRYETALRTRPGSPLLLNNLGYSAYLAGDWAGALDYFRRAVARAPHYDRAWHNLGLVYTRQEQYDRAVAAFEHTMDPAAAYNNVGYVCLQERKFGVAAAYFRAAKAKRSSYYARAEENLTTLRQLVAETGHGGASAAARGE